MTINPPAVTVNMDAHIEANRPITKTVVSERQQDGTIVSKVIEQ